MVGYGNGDAPPAALEPPAKRPRLEDDVDARRKSLKERLAKQVLPHVKQAVQDLPADLYKVNDIAVKVSWCLLYGVLSSGGPYKADSLSASRPLRSWLRTSSLARALTRRVVC